MKVQASVKIRCQHCQIVRRRSKKGGKPVLRVICKADQKHKQRQG